MKLSSRVVANRHQWISLLGALVIIVLLSLPVSGEVQARETRPVTQSDRSPATPAPIPLDQAGLTAAESTLLAQAQSGKVQVIVGLNVPFHVTEQTSLQERTAQETNAQQTRLSLLQSLSSYNTIVLSDSTKWSIPFVALEVDQNGLRALLASPNVTSVEPNGRNTIALSSAEPVIHAPQAWTAGYTGTGQTVAILDTGVDRTHAFLNNHVVSEACYSGHGVTSASSCPNGQITQTGTGAASPSICFTKTGLEDCAHGTHVAGIAAGYQSTSFSGVAPNANIIAVNIFSSDLGAYDSDIISGLNYVYGLRTTYSIAAVNLSLGDASRGSSSTCNSTSSSTTSMFQQLRSAGIAPVVATGNNGAALFVSFPACISYAVSVGATNDSNQIASFSNSSGTIQSLFAPGVSITSSVPVNSPADTGHTGFAAWNGTSMATPFVTGAFAVYRQFSTSATVDTIVSRFRTYGPGVCAPGGSVPRLDIYYAIIQQSVSPCTPPAAPANDLIGNATTISSLPYSINLSGIPNATTTGSDPNFCAPVLATVWYRYTPSVAQTVTLSTVGSNYDTVLAVFNATTLASVGCNDEYGSTHQSQVSLTLAAGTGYYIGIGAYNFGIEYNAALALNVTATATGPSITTQPQSQTIISGQTAALSVGATGSTPLTYQWYRGTAPSTTTPVGTNSPNFTTPTLSTTTSYWVRVSNGVSSVNSTTATVTVSSSLVTNGDFSAGTTGWTFSSATQSISAGVLNFAPLNGGGGLYQTASGNLTSNQTYDLTFNLGNYTNPKAINVIVRNADWSTIYSCGFNVSWLPNLMMQSYTVRFRAASTFNPIVQFWASGDSSMALTLDNIALQPSATSVSSTECLIEPPANVNLVVGGDFTDGVLWWAPFNAQMQQVDVGGNKMMEIARQDGSTYGGFYQYMGFGATAGDSLEFTFQLGNNSTTTNRVINMVLRDVDWIDIHSCFLNLPPSSPVNNYTMRVRTNIPWPNIILQGWIYTASYPSDPVMPFRFDNLSLQYKPSQTFGSTECPSAPAGSPEVVASETVETTVEATEIVTPTETMTPTDSATPTDTLTPTATDTEVAPEASPTQVPTALPFPTVDINPVITEEASPEPSGEVTDVPATGIPTALPFPTLPPPPPPTVILPTETPIPLTLPAAASMDDGAAEWAHTAGWTLATRDAGLAWYLTGSTSQERLQWQRQIDLRSLTPNITLAFDSWFVGDGVAMVLVSTDGANWQSVATIPASENWARIEVDLSAYPGTVVQLAFAWQDTDTTTVDQWGVDNVVVDAVQPPILTEVPTEAPTETFAPSETPTEVPTEVVPEIEPSEEATADAASG